MPPSAPTLVAPVGQLSPVGTFSFRFASSKTAPTSWDLQISEDPGAWSTGAYFWGAWGQTVGLAGYRVDYPYAGPELVHPRVYYWRARGKAGSSVGPWSAPVLFVPDPTAVRDPYGQWAAAMMGELAYPRPVSLIGTLLPTGAQVGQLLGLPYLGRMRLRDVEHPPATDRTVELLGWAMHVDYDGGWEIAAVTHDVGDWARSPSPTYGDDVIAGAICPVPSTHWRLGETSGAFAGAGSAVVNGTASGGLVRGVGSTASGDGGVAAGASAGWVDYGATYGANPAMTVAGWVVWDPAVPFVTQPLDRVSGTGPYSGWRCSIEPGGIPRLGIFEAAAGSQTVDSAVALTPGVPTHVAWVYPAAVGGSLAVYVNGERTGTLARARTIPAPVGGTLRTMPGGLTDELTIWQRELTSSEIKTLYLGGTTY